LITSKNINCVKIGSAIIESRVQFVARNYFVS